MASLLMGYFCESILNMFQIRSSHHVLPDRIRIEAAVTSTFCLSLLVSLKAAFNSRPCFACRDTPKRRSQQPQALPDMVSLEAAAAADVSDPEVEGLPRVPVHIPPNQPVVYEFSVHFQARRDLYRFFCKSFRMSNTSTHFRKLAELLLLLGAKILY